MSFNAELDVRIRNLVWKWGDTSAKRMFGGVCHLFKGSMFCGVYKDFLILRLGEEGANKALKSPLVRPFDITGRPMKGWVMVQPEGVKTDKALQNWLLKAREFVETLPPK